MSQTILGVKELTVEFRRYNSAAKLLGLDQSNLRVIHNLSVSVAEGEIVAVAGASGSGKSLLAGAILGILPANASVSGEMSFYGQPLTEKLQEQIRGRELALIPQSTAYLDPLMRVGKQIIGIRGSDEKREAIFRRYNLEESVARLFPFQLSGGMTRRILLSTAIIGDAKLIVADEPTPGMSVDMARRVFSHFRELADEGTGTLLITHDIDLAVEFADRVAVFYAGSTVEIAPAGDFKTGVEVLRHPYSKALWQAIPQNGFTPTPGSQPYAGALPEGCAFAPRCPLRTEACEEPVSMRKLRGGEVRCVHAV
ncbi:oligopeptide/dipeptide ABC transporter, ATP-binding protein [Treponema primitia ZAS-2]|uniref:Nickel import system ATP-binding protein NikD n=1 Tax=Treponema primitia (strain ATCC BAA-887 / DSM 12427 / ZAS-2) TaxID=545694 RepID=F5YKV4_TREPZ|nr:ABC transporter ATP-binding protein [Treponema primitia]AEF85945.1 oligopeptide/dipeptide ABC transporter, ATP-binding protein [Treponema primitia ZAS-2]